MPKAKLSKEEARRKIEHFCAYQDRCHKEVTEKLYSYGLYRSEVEELIGHLLEHQFLNEERYARNYVRGHFNQRGWGRVKLTSGLRTKGISQKLIDIALRELDGLPYREKLIEIGSRRFRNSSHSRTYHKDQDTIRFLQAKGYHYNEILEVFQEIRKRD